MTQPDFAEATKAACATLLKYDIAQLPVDVFLPISLEKNVYICKYETFCGLNGISLQELYRMNVSQHGFTLRRGSNCIIYYNALMSPKITRFTLAHEWGHVVLGHTLDGEVENQEANCFARNFLCPAVFADMFGLSTVEDYVRIFHVTKKAAEVALAFKETDLGNIKPRQKKALLSLFGNAASVNRPAGTQISVQRL